MRGMFFMEHAKKQACFFKNATISNECTIYYNILKPTDVCCDQESLNSVKSCKLWEIGLIVDGSGVLFIQKQALPCKGGDLFIIPPNTPHEYFRASNNEEITIKCLYFDPTKLFDGEIADIRSPRYCFGILDDNSSVAYAMLDQKTRNELNILYDSIQKELLTKDFEWKFFILSYLTQLLVLIKRYLNHSIKTVQYANPMEWNTVLAVIKTVEENYGNSSLTLDSISKTLFISKSYLSKIFKLVTGKSFSDYLKQVRLDKAKKLLIKSNITVQEIVYKCGLRDVSCFYRNFKMYTGLTPQEYKIKYADSAIKNNKKQGETLMSILNEISENLQKGQPKVVKELCEKALNEGAAPDLILKEGLLSGMSIIGEKFKRNEVYVPEVLVAARAMNMGMQILKPHLSSEATTKNIGRVCIGTVEGDLHDIGKNLVKMMMEVKGIDVIDLGADVSPETFVKTAIEENCDVICCSALLTTTMGVMNDVVKAAEAAGIRDKVKIMVGGAPVDDIFCRQIGADCYTEDATSAADAAVNFCLANK